MRVFWAFAAVVALVLGVGAGCSGDDDGGGAAVDDTATSTSASAAGDGDATTTTEADGTTTTDADDSEGGDPDVSADFPCDLVSTTTVEEVVGTPLAEGEALATANSRNESSWTSRKCAWEGDGSDQEVVLDVARADGFESGEVECIEPLSDAVTLDGPGDQAYWQWDGVLDQAELQVCTADALLEISIREWDEADEAGALAAATALAEQSLAGLG